MDSLIIILSSIICCTGQVAMVGALTSYPVRSVLIPTDKINVYLTRLSIEIPYLVVFISDVEGGDVEVRTYTNSKLDSNYIISMHDGVFF